MDIPKDDIEAMQRQLKENMEDDEYKIFLPAELREETEAIRDKMDRDFLALAVQAVKNPSIIPILHEKKCKLAILDALLKKGEADMPDIAEAIQDVDEKERSEFQFDPETFQDIFAHAWEDVKGFVFVRRKPRK